MMETALSRRRALVMGAASAAALAAAAVAPSALAQTAAAEVLSATEAARRAAAGELLLIDIRRPEEHRETGVAAGATLIDMRARDFGAQLFSLMEGDRSRPIALICATGGRSAYVSAQLAKAGLTAVHDVSEGMLGSDAGTGWLAKGLPTRSVP